MMVCRMNGTEQRMAPNKGFCRKLEGSALKLLPHFLSRDWARYKRNADTAPNGPEYPAAGLPLPEGRQQRQNTPKEQGTVYLLVMSRGGCPLP